MGIRIKFYIIILAILLPVFSRAQEPYAKIIESNFNTNSTKIYALEENASGEIWVGTSNGLYSFDGYNWVEYSLDKFTDKEIINLAYDAIRDRIWCISLKGEWGYIENDSLMLATDFIRDGDRVWDFQIDKNLLHYFFKSSDNFYLRSTQLDSTGSFSHIISTLDLRPFFRNSKTVGNGQIGLLNDKVLFRSPAGMILVKGDSIIGQQYIEQVSAENNRASVFNKEFIVVSNNSFIYTLDSMLSIKDSLKIDLDKNYIRYYNLEGNILVSLAPNGVSLYQKSKKINLLDKFYNNKIINDALRSSDGNTWIATSDSKLSTMPNVAIRKYSFGQTLVSGINSIKAFDDQLYMTSSEGKLIRFDTNYQFYLLQDFEEELRDLKKVEDELFVVSDRNIQFGQTKIPFVISCPKKIHVRGDTVFITTCSGMLVWDKPANHIIAQIEKDKRSYAIAGNSKEILFASDLNLFSIDPSDLSHKKVDHWPEKKIPYQIIYDQDKTFWINTQTNELYYYKEGELSLLKSNYLKNKSRIDNIKFTNGFLWIFSDGNTFIVKNGKLQPVAGKGNLVDLNFQDVEFFNGFYWLSSKQDLYRIPENLIHQENKKPKIIIEKVFANNQLEDIELPISLEYDENLVSFKLHSVYHYSSRPAKYYYRLIKDRKFGMQDILQSSEELITFSQLSPGNYRFQVSNNFHYFEEDPEISLDFTINIPYWRSWWFISLVLLSIICGTGYSFYYYYKTKAKREKEQEKLIERLEEMELEALHMKIHPHFINNLLNSVRHFLMVDDNRQKSVEVINAISLHMRSVYNQISRKTINLSEEIEFLQNYCHIQEIMTNKKINFTVNLNNDLKESQESIYIQCLIIQPLIENSIKYVNENPININLDLFNKEPFLLVSIKDNGAGIDTNNISQSGLRVIEKRIQLINSSKETLDIMDSKIQFRLKYDKIESSRYFDVDED